MILLASAPGGAVLSAPSSRLRRGAPLGLSVFLHGLVVVIWLGFPQVQFPTPDEKPMEVELVQDKAAPSVGPAAKSAPPPPAAQPGPVPLQQAPQLEPAPLADLSSPPVPQQGNQAKVEAVKAPTPSQKKPLPPTQNERDLVLSQISRHWHPPQGLSAYDKAELSVGVTVRADGSLAPPFDARQPWNPGDAIEGYDQLPANSLQRQTVEALYRAVRQAQPLKLPDGLRAKAPFAVKLRFRPKDLR